MEDQEEDLSTGFGPLFIREEQGDTDGSIVEQSDGNQNPKGQNFTGKPGKQPMPYLQEMDVLLKSCEKLTGIPFRSRHIEGYSEASLSKSSWNRGKEEIRTETHVEASSSPQDSSSSCYIDTHMDRTETKAERAESQNLGTIIHRHGTSYHSEMPLSSVGNNLCASMVECEGQLLGMLAMLESCMEEAGMEFEPQDRAADAGQDYVHIRKDPQHPTGTAQTEDQPESQTLLPVNADSFGKGNNASEAGEIGEAINSARKGSPHDHLVGCSKERPERQSNLVVDQRPDFLFSDLQVPLEQANQDPKVCGETSTGQRFNEEIETIEDIAKAGIDDINMTEERYKTDLESDMNRLRSQMEDCIEEVQRLEKRRKELLLEVLQLRGPRDEEDVERGSRDEEETEESIDRKAVELFTILRAEEEGRREERKREIQGLREERAEEERKTWKVNLERQGLQDELRRLRRKLFTVARDCAQSQATLNNQRCDVELLKTEEEKLNSLVLQLTEETCQLRSDQQEQVLELEAELQRRSSGQTSNPQEDLTECRRNSCEDVQQYVQGGLKALEDRYEPILEALLKRKEAAAGALLKAKEQSQELRVQVKPLREEIQKLELERTCLEERLKLTYMQRQEDAGRHKEAVRFLEERIRELRTELEIQKRKTKDLEELRENLTKQLLLYRTPTEVHHSCDQQGRT
ncbi:syncoilin isoform X1 [Xiphophorus couchianus]|uniref:syncoilin isoform X1 n=2 Tax=Xiphophorus couchianus TaxID=32473 RepID=UPI001016DE1D|nr:syncoilin-like isoform X1 [Xiphophorus couchianus]XP_027892902.1 syncoilin-like isoform X1 [Xiphophorus couchianus]XP_027892903.1 syncoilin-like isoform X1 [Xiphophorus couchianus]XP_027892904.1 syncoilin-like isoform X1 [Xiphophorus couchianus]XP_027892905.1 syncoilin-like isoform X1 [Xiphophorus couchianus]XP_027892906.1 syncoilin-like isoform X1 [Xiphophorus couchianus]XP_027892907.1 syncoilin-like isoform X1 [Xiphophorus couchianus]XP_027892908.1 syncoilin-like isoform X1 [Xiphophorus